MPQGMERRGCRASSPAVGGSAGSGKPSGLKAQNPEGRPPTSPAPEGSPAVPSPEGRERPCYL